MLTKKLAAGCLGLFSAIFVILSPIQVMAAIEPPTCTHTFLIYDHTDTVMSSYEHKYAYGTCYVSVTEQYNVYKCNCGFYFSRHLASKTESHSQPH